MFEHAPVTESCLTCHRPHGTVANNLLKQGEPFLCLQCHEMHFHNARLSPTGPYTLPSGGSTNPNGNLSFMARVQHALQQLPQQGARLRPALAGRHRAAARP